MGGISAKGVKCEGTKVMGYEPGSETNGKRRRCMQCPACLVTNDCGKCVYCK